MIILKTTEFNDWLEGMGPWAQSKVEDRLDRIREHNHFGDKKYLGDDLFELRWRNGRRVYFTFTVDADQRVSLMLLGGNKDGQHQDIARARKILVRETA